jgi:hypothetical protein
MDCGGVTDIRRGFTVGQTPLEQAPLSGHVFAFRGRQGDLIKLPWLERGRSRSGRERDHKKERIVQAPAPSRPFA